MGVKVVALLFHINILASILRNNYIILVLAKLTVELLLGDESLELFVDFTWFIAGGFGAALFFILLGGVEDLESEDPDWPWLFCSWAFGLHRGKKDKYFLIDQG